MDMLLINKDQKLSNPYKVTTMGNAIKDVDVKKRVVTGMFNTSFFIDHDMDMLLPGAAKKSIKERGVGTNSGNKIKQTPPKWAKKQCFLSFFRLKFVTMPPKHAKNSDSPKKH